MFVRYIKLYTTAVKFKDANSPSLELPSDQQKKEASFSGKHVLDLTESSVTVVNDIYMFCNTTVALCNKLSHFVISSFFLDISTLYILTAQHNKINGGMEIRWFP